MEVNVTTLISGFSLIIAVIVAISNIRNKNYLNDKDNVSQITTLIVKLENIADGINEIKSDMRNVKNDVQDLRERIAIVENATKSAHHRIDLISGQERE